jgi:hypothetical protein
MRFLLPVLLLFPTLAASGQSAPAATDDCSGMYSFLRDGEFVQITLEDNGKVSGFISRFGDSDSDKNTFLDQFFESGKLDGSHLTFTTKQVHSSWYAFDGTLGRGGAKSPSDEGYYVARGTLTRFKTDSEKKVSQEMRKVEFKSFPRN